MHEPEFSRRVGFLRAAGLVIRDDAPGCVSAMCACGLEMGPDGHLAIRGERIRAYCAGCWVRVPPDDAPLEVDLGEAICLAARKAGIRARIEERETLIDGEQWRIILEERS